MEQKAALKVLRDLVKEHGKMAAVALVADAAAVSEGTAYGWLRRESVPEWRLPAIAALAKSRRVSA